MSCLWILEEDPPDCFRTRHLCVKEAHDEKSELQACAWRAFDALPLLGTVNAITCAKISVEEEDLGIERDGRYWWLIFPKAGLLQQVLDGVDVSCDRQVTDVQGLEGGNRGLLNRYWFSNGGWQQELASKFLKVCWPVFNKVAEKQPDSEFVVAIKSLCANELTVLREDL